MAFVNVLSITFISQNQCSLHEVLTQILTSLAECGHDRKRVCLEPSISPGMGKSLEICFLPPKSPKCGTLVRNRLGSPFCV